MNQEEHDALANMSEEDARAWLEERYGQVWNTEEVMKDFEVTSFYMGMAFCKRRSDGKEGALSFIHSPRFYFSFR